MTNRDDRRTCEECDQVVTLIRPSVPSFMLGAGRWERNARRYHDLAHAIFVTAIGCASTPV